MEACSSSNMCLLLFPLLQVTTESPISTQSHHNSQIIYNQRFTSQLVQLVVHVSLLHTPTHILVNSCIRHVQRVSQKTLSELLFCECGLPLPVKQPTSSGRPGTLKPGFAKRQFKKCFFLGHSVYLLRRFTLQLVQLVVHVSLLHTPTQNTGPFLR